ncbi:MAG TPA: integrase, partial [Gammaproteobacteria bacterium]|nr:integrase [Gammaproteobacteria bacterium]
MDKLVKIHQKQLAQQELDSAWNSARRYAQKSRSENTWRAYQNDWQQFEAWCLKLNLRVLPAEPETVAMFIASQAADGLNPSTLTRRLAAIRMVHLGAGYPSPHNTIFVSEVLRGIRRDWGRPPERKAAAIDEEIKKMVDAAESKTLKYLRDR